MSRRCAGPDGRCSTVTSRVPGPQPAMPTATSAHLRTAAVIVGASAESAAAPSIHPAKNRAENALRRARFRVAPGSRPMTAIEARRSTNGGGLGGVLKRGAAMSATEPGHLPSRHRCPDARAGPAPRTRRGRCLRGRIGDDRGSAGRAQRSRRRRSYNASAMSRTPPTRCWSSPSQRACCSGLRSWRPHR